MDRLYEIQDLMEVTARITTAGQPDLVQLEAVADQGYHLVINLGQSDADRSATNEAQWVEQLGITYMHIPVEFAAPSLQDFTRFLNTMNLHQEGRCFVHGSGNKRASVFVALYLAIANELTTEEAWLHINSVWEPDLIWTNFFHEVLKAYVNVIRSEI